MEVFVARQPIFDHHLRVFGYELLFRSGTENIFTHQDGDQATCSVVNGTLHVFGRELLTTQSKCFINATRRVLLEELYTVLPPQHCVVELLENVEPDEEVIEGCRRLKSLGYMLALDDFVLYQKIEPLLKLADLLKVDFLVTKGEERRILLNEAVPRGMKLLAEKLETRDDFLTALKLGYHYFQGYFFCKPEIVTRKDIPGYKLNYLRILQEMSKPELDFDDLATIIKQDVSLSVKLLRFLNSATFGLRNEVTSIKQALVLLGERAVRKWVWVLALAGVSDDRPSELVVTTLVRARFGEQIAADAGFAGREYDLFLLGLLSLIDVLVGRPMPDVLAELGVQPELQGALAMDGSRLSKVPQLVVGYERGNWDEMERCAKELGIGEGRIPEVYADAVEWAEKIFKPVR